MTRLSGPTSTCPRSEVALPHPHSSPPPAPFDAAAAALLGHRELALHLSAAEDPEPLGESNVHRQVAVPAVRGAAAELLGEAAGLDAMKVRQPRVLQAKTMLRGRRDRDGASEVRDRPIGAPGQPVRPSEQR